MQPIKRINIPTPCHEDWQQMTSVAQGRHCQSCCKTVIDFTAMSNADIIAYLSTHKKVCGHITGTKLAAINHELEVRNRKRFTWKGFIAAASLSVLFPTLKAEAQSKPGTEQAPVTPDSFASGNIAQADTVGYVIIKGVVTAKDDGLPVPAATIKVKDKGINVSTHTERDGSFTLRVPINTKRILVSFLGYQTKEIKLRDIEGHQTVTLNPVLETSFSGGMEVYVNF
jgi:hypothetical protein